MLGLILPFLLLGADPVTHVNPKYPVILVEEIDDAHVKAISETIDAEIAKGAEGIVFKLNSPGGSVWEGEKLAQKIESLNVPTVGVVDVNCMSMCMYILESTNTRLMTKRSQLMMHQPAYGRIGGNATELDNLAKSLESTNQAMAEHITARTKVTPEEYLKKIKYTEWWMNYKEAIDLAFVDGLADASEVKNAIVPQPKVDLGFLLHF